jgi:hypothetical protein
MPTHLPDVISDPGHPDQFDTDGGNCPDARRRPAREFDPELTGSESPVSEW